MFLKFNAILSTTILPLDGTYEVATLTNTKNIDITNVSHYIGHPDTKNIVESLGAIQAPTKLFTGLNIGESALAVSIKQGRSSRVTEGFTNPHQNVGIDDLDFRMIIRID